ncbi:MAG: glycosyltransferase [Halioglobus sp.]
MSIEIHDTGSVTVKLRFVISNMGTKKDALISIVNGNRKGYIYDCLESIRRHTAEISYDILVIDNCTGDQRLQEIENSGARLIINETQKGFADNHSQALAFMGEYRHLILFNDDAFLDNNAFRVMVDAANAGSNVAIVGSRIADPDGTPQPSAAPFPNITYFIKNVVGLDQKPGDRYSEFFARYIDYEATQDVDWVSGCCMLITGEFIESFGFMDTRYFMFLEDADICRRAHSNGYRVTYRADAKITHLGGGSSKDDKGNGQKRMMQPKLFLETQRSRLLYLRKISITSYLAYLLFINLFLPVKLCRAWFRGEREWVSTLLAELPQRPLV